MSRVYLVRHAMHGLIGKQLAGRMPGVQLSPEGRLQAARVGEHFAQLQVSSVITSPLERCVQTAEPIAQGHRLMMVTDEQVNEIDCGEWTGRGFAALADDPRWRSWNDERGLSQVPGGESIQQVQSRVMAALADCLVRESGPVVIVSHSDVIKVAVLTLLGGVLDWHDRIDIDPASITTIDLWPGGGKVCRMNEMVIA